MTPDLNAPTPLLARLTDLDRNRLAEALQALLAHGSILGLEAGQAELYLWCRQNLEWLREVAAVVGLQVRDRGATEVKLTIEELNRLLKEKLLPDLKEPPSRGRLLEILRQGQRYNLVRLVTADPFEQSLLEVLPTLKRVIPFQDLADWTRTAELHRNPGATPAEDPEEDEVKA